MQDKEKVESDGVIYVTKNEKRRKKKKEGKKKTKHRAQTLLPFNLWVIKIIISQRPSSIKEIDGGHRWTSTPTHTHMQGDKSLFPPGCERW